MKKTILSDTVGQTVKLYGVFTWPSFFATIRFWTGSYVALEQFLPKKGKILDLGCGYGIFANYLALTSKGRKIIGVDYDKSKVARANQGIKNTMFLVGDATKMKWSNLSAILLHDVLHHLDSFEAQADLVQKCQKMLVKNGVLFVVEVDKKPLWKLVLGRITDFIMYKGTPVYYRYKKDMIVLLKRYFVGKIVTKRLPNTPFPQLLYICQKG